MDSSAVPLPKESDTNTPERDSPNMMDSPIHISVPSINISVSASVEGPPATTHSGFKTLTAGSVSSTSSVPRRVRAASAANSKGSVFSQSAQNDLKESVCLQDHLKQLAHVLKSVDNLEQPDPIVAKSASMILEEKDVLIPKELDLNEDKNVKILFDMLDISSKGAISHSEILHFLKHVRAAYNERENVELPLPEDDVELVNLVHAWFAPVYESAQIEMDLKQFTPWIRNHPEVVDYMRIVDEFKLKDINIWTELMAANNVIFEGGSSAELKAASLNQLVERLTNGNLSNLTLTTHNILTFSKAPRATEHATGPEQAYSAGSPAIPPAIQSTSIFKKLRERSSSLSNHPAPSIPEPTPPTAGDSNTPPTTLQRRGGVQVTQQMNVTMDQGGNGITIREYGEKFETVFLLTFPSFTTGEMFLKKLLERYDVPPYVDLALSKRIQLQVCKILLRWMETFPIDFTENMIGILREFLVQNSYLKTLNMPELVKALEDLESSNTTNIRAYPFLKDLLDGLTLKSYKSTIHTYHNCFSGTSLVKAILTNFPGYNEHSASTLGSNLLKDRIIVHIHDKQFINSDAEYYQIHPSILGLKNEEPVELARLSDLLDLQPDQFKAVEPLRNGYAHMSYALLKFTEACAARNSDKPLIALHELHQIAKSDNPAEKLTWFFQTFVESTDGILNVVDMNILTDTIKNYYSSKKIKFEILQRLYEELYEYVNNFGWTPFKESDDWKSLKETYGLPPELFKFRPYHTLNTRNLNIEQIPMESVEPAPRTRARALSKETQQRRPSLFSTSKLPNLKYDIFDYDEVDLAKQWTLIEYEHYVHIHRSEFLNQAWSKGRGNVLAKNLIKFINRFNTQSHWVSTRIVEAKTLKQRVKVVERFIKIMEVLKQYQNYSGMMSIYASLNSAPISRLKYTQAALSKPYQKIEQEIQEFMSPNNNYKVYREAVHKAFESASPAIPYIGLYLTDLTFIDDGNAKKVAGLINFVQRTQVADVVTPLLAFQERQFNFKKVDNVHTFLMDMPIVSDDELYQASLAIEPRGAEAKDIQ